MRVVRRPSTSWLRCSSIQPPTLTRREKSPRPTASALFRRSRSGWVIRLTRNHTTAVPNRIASELRNRIVLWVERKVCALIQDRHGPNRAGPFGLLQPAADAIKAFLKEDFTPAHVRKTYYWLAPAIEMADGLFVLSSIVDISARKLAEAAHRRLEEQLREARRRRAQQAQ